MGRLLVPLFMCVCADWLAVHARENCSGEGVVPDFDYSTRR
jgi:hypothetical protein